MKLEGKTAIVTGAGGYLGRGTAMQLAQEGAKVMVNDVNLTEAQKTVDAIIHQGGQAIADGTDVTRSDDVNKMVVRMLDRWGQIDILVNNAGDIRDALLPAMTDEQWEFVIDLNLKGSFYCARAVSSHMIERRYGKIVNTTSMAYKGNAGQANYSAAKSGVVGLTLAIGLELARYNINVNCISPGMIETPRTNTLDKTIVERIVKLTPLRRMGEISDIANAVLFLVSDDSKYITRQVIHISGGMEGF
ncbi:MAG: 3-oxoacyl-ACP reductase FabG [Proteobacteria bacterium]|nr:3-oxoacyl-ACP reductase FabG [Pseudomonadota bacterium]MBU1695555.1 3-oxoacyl-ACP reductase FabG [Pseudomonadota bacterium]